eukprot:113120_1
MSSSNNYVTQNWHGDSVGIKTETGYIHIEHNKKDTSLMFYSDNIDKKQFKNIQQLENVLTSTNHKIFIEWCQLSNGSYIYFDLLKVVQQLQTYKCINVNLLNINNKNNITLHKSCYFDESVSINSQLRTTDILITSPLRSTLATYSPMGIFNNHQLYLGPTPNKQFIHQFKIIYIFNCCHKRNPYELIENTASERLFNVAKWTSCTNTNSFIYKRLEGDEKSNNNQKSQMNGWEYLDAMIDEIHSNLHKGNVLIHCLAGAHRSPFITGCYLLKYGLKQPNISVEDIYNYLKQKRSIVQELSFDKEMSLYQKYLTEGKIDTINIRKCKTKKWKQKFKDVKKINKSVIRKEGFRICVENYVNVVKEIEFVGVKNEIYIVNCKHTVFKIDSKVKAVIIDSCQTIQVEISSVLMSIAMVNSKGCILCLKNNVPIINIDKCDGVRIIMFQELLNKQPQIITSLTSNVKLSVPDGDSNWKDVSIPCQFITKIDPKSKQVSTVPVSDIA